jgi:hypothetical protein
MLVLVLFVGVALTAAITMALVPVLTGLTERQRARSAADASALAGAIGGRVSASDMARRNQAVLVGWSERGDEVVVTVRVGDHEVSARATDGS